MKRAISSLAVATLLLASLSNPARMRAVDVFWSGDYGFNPPGVVISPGESVTWWNVDLFGFPVQVTSDVPSAIRIIFRSCWRILATPQR